MDADSLLDRPATALSRGQRQRVTIARMLLGDPAVLFLDEPTTGLDPTAAKSLRDQLDELAAEGRTLCYSTHNLYEAELLEGLTGVVFGCHERTMNYVAPDVGVNVQTVVSPL